MTIAGVVFGIAIAVAGYFIWTRKLRDIVSGMPNTGKPEERHPQVGKVEPPVRFDPPPPSKKLVD